MLYTQYSTWFSVQHSPIVTSFGWWLTEWDPSSSSKNMDFEFEFLSCKYFIDPAREINFFSFDLSVVIKPANMCTHTSVGSRPIRGSRGAVGGSVPPKLITPAAVGRRAPARVSLLLWYGSGSFSNSVSSPLQEQSGITRFHLASYHIYKWSH